MNAKKSLIRSLLGSDIEEFTYEAGGFEWVGFKQYAERMDRPNADEAMDIVDSAWRQFHENDIRLVVGPSVLKVGRGKYVQSWDMAQGKSPKLYSQIFALPELPVLDIIELMKVGSHNDFSIVHNSVHQRWPKIKAAMNEVLKLVPFEIQSADEAGLQATFLKTVKKPIARKIGKILLHVDSDLHSALESDIGELGIEIPMDPKIPEIPDYEAMAAEYVVATGKFKLWWD